MGIHARAKQEAFDFGFGGSKGVAGFAFKLLGFATRAEIQHQAA
jgi:hypothetical protein